MYLALIGYAGMNIMMMKMIEQVRLNKCENSVYRRECM